MVFAYTTMFSIPYLMRVYRSCVELCADWLLPFSVASGIRRSAIFVLSTITPIVDKRRLLTSLSAITANISPTYHYRNLTGVRRLDITDMYTNSHNFISLSGVGKLCTRQFFDFVS